MPGAAVALLLVAAAYAGWGSGTAPFSVAADVAISVPSAAFVAAIVLQRRWPDFSPWKRLTPKRPVRDGGAAVWLVVVAVLVAIELASYFHGGPRSRYPTISSAEDALFHDRAARAAAWFVWLVVGGFLARR